VRPRTSYKIQDLADWLAKYDEIHKAGSMREPYDFETWKLIVENVCLDYADAMGYKS